MVEGSPRWSSGTAAQEAAFAAAEAAIAAAESPTAVADRSELDAGQARTQTEALDGALTILHVWAATALIHRLHVVRTGAL